MQLKQLSILLAGLAVAGTASAQTLTFAGGGASATRQTIRDAVIRSICGASTAAPAAPTINVYENATNVRRITCNSTAIAGFTALDFNYDNTTGSFLGIGPVSGTAGGAAPYTVAGGVQRVNIATCGSPTVTTIEGKRVNLFTGCSNETTLQQALVGNADVEPALFRGVNLPAGVATPNFSNIESRGQWGVVFGIGASTALWTALRDDQIAAGLLPAACATATPTSPNLVVGATTFPGGCAPTISTAQVISLSIANAGPLNTDWTPLFRSAPPAAATQTVRWARRVAGSGTQSSFNAVFMNNPCSPNGLAPSTQPESGPTYVVTESGSGGALLNFLGGSANTGTSNDGLTRYAAGIITRESAPGSGTGTPNWGFLKLDGVYPIKANAQNGAYRWVAEQVLTLRATAPAAVRSFYEQLATATGSPTVIASLSGTDGIVALPGIADSSDPQYAAQATRYRTLGNSCTAPQIVE
jgi:hypothetical protein